VCMTSRRDGDLYKSAYDFIKQAWHNNFFSIIQHKSRHKSDIILK
jgi:hypothetical protein